MKRRVPKKPNLRPTSAPLDIRDYRRLKAVVDKEDRSVGRTVRRAIVAYLNDHAPSDFSSSTGLVS